MPTFRGMIEFYFEGTDDEAARLFVEAVAEKIEAAQPAITHPVCFGHEHVSDAQIEEEHYRRLNSLGRGR